MPDSYDLKYIKHTLDLFSDVFKLASAVFLIKSNGKYTVYDNLIPQLTL